MPRAKINPHGPDSGWDRRMTMAQEIITDRDDEIIELHRHLELALTSNHHLKAELERLQPHGSCSNTNGDGI